MDIRAISLPYSAKSAQTLRAAKDETAQSRLQSAKATLSMMIQAQKEQGEDAKAAAKKKVEQLKERLKMLEQMFSGDPEKLAKLLAQLSKELKAAVKSYAAAGGAIADVGSTTPQAKTGTADTPMTDSGSVESVTPAPTAGDDSRQDTATDEDKTQPGTHPYAKSAETQKTEEKQAEAKEDADFAKDIRDLMRKIKALLERTKTETEAKPANEDTKDAITEADNALKSLNEDVSDLEQSSGQALFTSGLIISLKI